MNITNFRRAVAFAIDKHRIIDEGWLGHAELLDCHIPKQHPACIDDEMDYHYYDKQVDKGIELLESEGFIDTDGDGWREGPGPDGPGTVILDTIVVEGHPTTQVDIFVDTVVQALFSLNISAEARQTSFRDYFPFQISCPGVRDRDIWVREFDWKNFHLGHYARDMSSDVLQIMNMNYPNWSNSTWDSLVPNMLNSLDYDEMISTAKEMEKIWVHACPAIVLYQNNYITAYRTDKFEDVTTSIFDGIPNFYTNMKVHSTSENSIGGTYTWANPLDILSFNHFITSNSRYASNILQMLFDSLVRIGPDGSEISWMCSSFEIQTHDNFDFIPDGHLRIIVNIIDNATWSDGSPITAEDFAFSLLFIKDNVPIQEACLRNLLYCYPTTHHQFICEFSTESYWHWHDIAYQAVIPRHIWEPFTEKYEEYQPSPSTLLEMVTSGPFKPTNWTQGDFVILEQNPYYWKNPRNLEYNTTTTSESSYSSVTKRSPFSYTILSMIGSFSCVVTVGILIIRYHSKSS
jgi:ABC-type transport system substrate-binding protein